MSGFNKTLNILIFLLAAASVVFGYFLFEKRSQLRRRGDDLAKFVIEIAGILDEDSGTTVKKGLVFKRLEVDKTKPGYKAENKKVSLYHNNFANLKTVLKPVREQANNLIGQRKALSDTLHSVLVELEIPNANEFEAPTFMDMAKYGDQDTKLIEIVQKVTARDNAIMAQIGDSAGVIGKTLDVPSLKKLDEYTTPLSEFAAMVQALKKRSDTYASNIGELCRIFEVSSPSLDGEDYEAALDTIKTEMQGQKDEFEQTKVDLAQTKDELKDTKEKLEEKIKVIEAKDKKIADLTKKLGEFVRDPDKVSAKELNLKLKLEGKVLRVNNKWGFVVIDLGQNNKMLVGSKKKEVPVPLPEDAEMDVARGSQYLGKIRIVKVGENCAIGDIIAETAAGELKPGDKVFFARENKVENQDKIENPEEDYNIQ